jgi:F-box/leucine-rich repeat protein 2/20
VCKKWSKISGRLVRSLKVLDWDFLESGRLVYRFPNLSEVNIVPACIHMPRNSGITLSNKYVSVHVCSQIVHDGFIRKNDMLQAKVVDKGIQILVQGCTNLRKLVLIGATEEGLSCVAEECYMLQELELHSCTDWALKELQGVETYKF